MLVNPYAQKFETFGTSRLLCETLGVVGMGVRDISNSRRLWKIQSIYAPIRRALGGLRFRLTDQNNFTTFLNQRDLEVLIGEGLPGEVCRWSGSTYVSPSSSEWVGFYMDEEDLLDDLLEQEMSLRASHPSVLPYGLEMARRLHREEKNDSEELWSMLWDMYPETGYGPDYRLHTVLNRWTRIEHRRVQWEPNTYKQTAPNS